MKQELFYDVFNTNMLDSPCHMIFRFKHRIRYLILRPKVVQALVLGCVKRFKLYNEALETGTEYKIKNRRELYLLLKEYYNCVPKSYNNRADYRMVTILMNFLMGYSQWVQFITFEKKDLVELFRRNDCFNKKCKIEIKELDDKTQIDRSVLEIVHLDKYDDMSHGPLITFAVTNKDWDIMYHGIKVVDKDDNLIKYRFHNYIESYRDYAPKC
jgi:hypothetical protein